MTIRLLVVDDSRVDRELFMALMLGDGKSSWLRDVTFTLVAGPLPDPQDYRAYDGVILDYHLSSGVTGMELASMIHQMDWRIPVMLMTGSAPDELPGDLHDYVDYVTFKDSITTGRRYDDLFGCTRAFVRSIARQHDAVT